MAMPVTAQNRKRGMSFIRIPPFFGRNKKISQNKLTVTTTRIRFSPKGRISDGDIVFTTLKLIPNNKLAAINAV